MCCSWSLSSAFPRFRCCHSCQRKSVLAKSYLLGCSVLLCCWCSALAASAGLHLFVVFIKWMKHLAQRSVELKWEKVLSKCPAKNVLVCFAVRENPCK